MLMMDLEIDVTQDDIEKGVRANTAECPVSLAFQRALKEIGLTSEVVFCYSVYEHMLVHHREEYINYNAADPDRCKVVSGKTSEDVLKKIKLFDRGESIEPFSFTQKLEILREEFFK